MRSVVAVLLFGIVGGWCWFAQPWSSEPASQGDVLRSAERPAVRSPAQVLGPEHRAPVEPLRTSPLDASSEPERTGRIRGRVVTEEGIPLEDALIEARPLGLDRDAIGPSFRQAATTDREGQYLIEGLAPIAYSLHASRPGFDIQAVDPRPRWLVGTYAAFLARPLGTVDLRVIQRDGTPLAEALILGRRLDGEDREEPTAKPWTARDPRIELPAGVWELFVDTTDRESPAWRSAKLRLDVRPGQSTAPATLRVTRVYSITGTIAAASGPRLPDRCVMRLRLDPEALLLAPGVEAFAGPPLAERALAPFPSPASFEFRGLFPGRYRLEVVDLDRSTEHPLAAAEVRLGQRDEGLHMVLAEPDASDAVAVIVTAPDGSPLGGLRFRGAVIESERARSGSFDPRELAVVSESAGRYLIRLPNSPEELPQDTALEFVVQTRHRLHGTAIGRTEYPPRGPIRLEWQPESRLVLQVAEADQWRNARGLSLELVGPALFAPLIVPLDDLEDDGRLVIDPIHAGNVRLALIGEDPRMDPWRLPLVDLLVPRGELVHALTLPALASLELVAPSDGALPAALAFHREEGQAGESISFAVRIPAIRQRVTRIGPFPPGRYTLLAWSDPALPMMTIDAVGPTRLTWEPRRPTGLLVRLTDPRGSFARAGFEDGDKILAIDGRPLAIESNWHALQRRLWFRVEEVVVSVERRGQPFTLNFNFGAALLEAGTTGGELSPAFR